MLLETKVILGCIICFNLILGLRGYFAEKYEENLKRRKGECMRKPDN